MMGGKVKWLPPSDNVLYQGHAALWRKGLATLLIWPAAPLILQKSAITLPLLSS